MTPQAKAEATRQVIERMEAALAAAAAEEEAKKKQAEVCMGGWVNG